MLHNIWRNWKGIQWPGSWIVLLIKVSLRSKRFRLVSEQRKTEDRGSCRGTGFSVLVEREVKQDPKNEVGGGGEEGRKRLQTNPSILKTERSAWLARLVEQCWYVLIKGLFHTKRRVWYVTRILSFSGCCLFWSARFVLQCKSIFFDLFWNVRLFLRLNKGFRSFNLFSKVPPGSE